MYSALSPTTLSTLAANGKNSKLNFWVSQPPYIFCFDVFVHRSAYKKVQVVHVFANDWHVGEHQCLSINPVLFGWFSLFTSPAVPLSGAGLLCLCIMVFLFKSLVIAFHSTNLDIFSLIPSDRFHMWKPLHSHVSVNSNCYLQSKNILSLATSWSLIAESN